MAYLFKHTPLQTNFAVNLTCLVPTENAEAGRPERLDLKRMLWHFLHFRLDVVTSRLEHELEQLKKRIHILEGFEKVFDALDEIIRLIRKSDGKADAAEKIMKRFALDDAQTDAILELKLYRLARLEILVIQNELKEKRSRTRADQRAAQGRRRPLDAGARRARADPEDLRRQAPHGHRRGRRDRVRRRGVHRRRRQRRHRVARRLGEAAEGSQGSVDHPSARGRQPCWRRWPAARDRRWCSSPTSASRTPPAFVDVPASTGYGEPVQRLFKFKDNERVVAVFSLDPRAIGDIGRANAGGDDEQATIADADVPVPPVHALAVTSDGYSLRFSLANVAEPSARGPDDAMPVRPMAPRSWASASSPATKP